MQPLKSYSPPPARTSSFSSILSDYSPFPERSLSSRLLESAERERLPGNSFKSSVLRFCNGLIGAGSLSLPYAMHEMGLLIGVVVILLTAAASGFSSRLLVECTIGTQKGSYVALATHVDGAGMPWSTCATLFSVGMFCFGTSCAFIKIIMTAMPAVFGALLCDNEFLDRHAADDTSCIGGSFTLHVLLEPHAWIMSYALLVILPMLVFAGNLQKASLLQSAVALLSNIYLAGVVGLRFYFGDYILSWSQVLNNLKTPKLNLMQPNNKFFLGAAVVLQVFSSQWILLPLYHGLQRKSFVRISRVTRFSVTIALHMYLFVAVLGYLTWLDATKGNVLENFSPLDWPINVSRMALTISLTTGVVLNLVALSDLIMERCSKIRSQSLLRMSILGASFIVAVFVPGVDVIFGMTGAIAGSGINFVLPSMFYISLGIGSRINWLLAWVLMIAGFVIAVGSTVTLLASAILG